MARRWMFVLFSALISSVCYALFDGLVDGNSECNEVCDRTFPQNAHETGEYGSCCKRGCRFFSLVELISGYGHANETQTSCMASCLEAYPSNTDQSYACGFGCTKQVPQANHFSLNGPPPGALPSAYQTMVDRVWRIVDVSWSLSVRRQDGGGILVVQSLVQSPKLQDEGEYQSEHLDLDVPEVRDDLNDRDLALGPSSDLVITLNSYGSSQDVGVDWLSCVSRKSGLPRWLLAVVIFACVAVTVWLCFVAPSNPQKVSVSCNFDCKPTTELAKKVELGGAGPLPIKIAVDRV